MNASDISIVRENGKLIIRAGDDLFTQYIYKDEKRSKPVLYPVIGPLETPLTRKYPLEEKSEGEESDHPHHASLWYTHGDVNGVDFWAIGKNKGKIIHQEFLEIKGNSFTSSNFWKDGEGKTICQDQRTLSFYEFDQNERAIDIEITLMATVEDLVLGDTKEGSMGIRMAPEFRLRGKVARGSCLNSEGIVGKSIWGKRASWVSYWAKFDKQNMAISIFDHPSNPRHPTWWHARDYGLVAANPFGQHDFERKPKGTGDMKLSLGEKVSFKYGFLFHLGDPLDSNVAQKYLEWSKENI
ncbi:MAG: PmoA family protein [Verrucomicrobiota bacterium]|nr:PmoA family protein [Verrucomicrobiota bacterium]